MATGNWTKKAKNVYGQSERHRSIVVKRIECKECGGGSLYILQAILQVGLVIVIVTCTSK
jgi:hypothetical protein